MFGEQYSQFLHVFYAISPACPVSPVFRLTQSNSEPPHKPMSARSPFALKKNHLSLCPRFQPHKISTFSSPFFIAVEQAARDIERERRGRESATRAKEKLLDDNAQLRAEMTKAEERAASLEDRLTATRRCVASFKLPFLGGGLRESLRCIAMGCWCE